MPTLEYTLERTDEPDAPEMGRFVEIRPVVMEGYPDAHHVFLSVGVQQFCVTTWGCETRDEAEWMARMLRRALRNLYDQMTAGA